MGYLLLFVLFLLVMQFAFFLLPFLLPVIAILWIYSFFKKPNVRVYSTSYSFNPYSAPNQNPFGSEPKVIPTRKPLEDSIYVEFTERSDEEVL